MSGLFYGEKYEQLMAARPAIETAGAYVPPTIPFAQTMLDEALMASSLPTINEVDAADVNPEQISQRIKIPDDLMDLLVASALELSECFGGPLILRSSGNGDATGVNVYRSKRHQTDAVTISSAFKDVLGSYFGQKGRIYRARGNISTGFAIFMQPLVGSVVDAAKFEYGSGDTMPVELFYTPYSGNTRIGNVREAIAGIRLEAGAGSAVKNSALPLFKFEPHTNDNQPVLEALEEAAYEIPASDRGSYDKVTDYQPFRFRDGVWKREASYNYQIDSTCEQPFTLGALKQQLERIHQQFGGRRYFEFAVAQQRDQEILYIVQSGDLDAFHALNPSILDELTPESIILEGSRVEAAAVNTPQLGAIVCMTDNQSLDIYEFDKSSTAEEGYILVFAAQTWQSMKRLHLQRLKNVKAIISLQSPSGNHASPLTDHLRGYNEALGIPLISHFSPHTGNEAWQSLHGWSDYQKSLIVRPGQFQVLCDATSNEAVVVNLAK